MSSFKELFEQSYGEGSLNDDFLITAPSAEFLAEKYSLQVGSVIYQVQSTENESWIDVPKGLYDSIVKFRNRRIVNIR